MIIELQKILDLEIAVKKIHVGGDMNRSFKVNNPSVLLPLGNNNVSPLPASSLKGLLRQLACIVSHWEGLKDEYFELFGEDLGGRCYEDGSGEEKPGKLLFVNIGLAKTNVMSLVFPSVRINPVTRTVAEGGLWFYQFFTSTSKEPLRIKYEIWSITGLTDSEKRLLCKTLLLLKYRDIGGRITVGLGRITEVKIYPEDFCREV